MIKILSKLKEFMDAPYLSTWIFIKSFILKQRELNVTSYVDDP